VTAFITRRLSAIRRSPATLLWVVYTLAAIGIAFQQRFAGLRDHGYTTYENYRIFRNSFGHLLQGLNPYTAYPAEQWDLFKYSPTFALAMGPFSALPDLAGLIVWDLLNALPLLWAILHLPGLTDAKRRFFAWFVLPELFINLQNSQSNGLMAAFFLLAYIDLERDRPAAAAGWTVGGAFIKIFGGAAALPALLYASRWRFIGAAALWTLLLAAAPLAVLSISGTIQVYQWWWELLRDDHAASLGLSVAGWLQAWFGLQPPKMAVTAVGLALLLASAWAGQRQKALVWASSLLWVVIFNHKAESPTFIIALCGAALWYCADLAPARWKTILLWAAFIGASYFPSDLCPAVLRRTIATPYVLKVVPCIAIWIMLTWRLFADKLAHNK
jgi:Glycosyltransferase family 87